MALWYSLEIDRELGERSNSRHGAFIYMYKLGGEEYAKRYMGGNTCDCVDIHLQTVHLKDAQKVMLK